MNNENLIVSPISADTLFSKNFFLTVKKEVADNTKEIAITVSSIIGLCIMLGAYLGYFGMGGTESTVWIYRFIFLTIGCVVGSLSFSNLKTKTGRITSLLMPDTQFDKFFVRWIAAVPLLILVMIIAYYCGEWSRIITFKLTAGENIIASASHYCMVTNPWEIVSTGKGMIDTYATIIIIVAYFMNQSFYILGSVIWPKLSFIKTFAALWVLQTILSIILLNSRIDNLVNFDSVNNFMCAVVIAEVIITISMYALTYFRYRHYQIVYKLF